MTKETVPYVGKLSDDFEEFDDDTSINIWEIVKKYRMILIPLTFGLALLFLGLFLLLGDWNKTTDVIVLGTTEDDKGYLIIEVSGAVKSPGVYKLDSGLRVADALDVAGGLDESADIDWIDKVLNRASFIEDGQKIYIPSVGKQTQGQSASNNDGYQSVSSVKSAENTQLVNINTSSANELDSLWGIGQVTAQNIIEQRPYSTVEELLTRKILKSNVYERNKDLLTVY